MNKRALIVERNKSLAQEIRDRVESLGHEVTHASTQNDALKALGGARAFDYVLVGLEIPVAKGRLARTQHGISLIRKIRALQLIKRIPVFALVQKERASEKLAIEAMRDWGADDVVHMPLPDEGFTLEVRITDILKNRKMRSLEKKNGLGRQGGIAIDMIKEACQQYVASHGDGGAMEVRALMVQGPKTGHADPSGEGVQPIILVTAHDPGVSDHLVSVMRTGGMEFTQYVQKAEGHRLTPPAAPGPKAQEKPAPFGSQRRELVIEKDRVTICGVESWRDCAQPDLRRVLLRLSKKDKDGFVRLRGAMLDKELGRNASNPIARRIKDFRDRVSEALAREGIVCGREDVIASRGGYHFTSWMQVRMEGEADQANEEPLNDRQKWILEEVQKGGRLTTREITAHTKKTRSTVVRDLKGLRERGLIALNGEGHYILGDGLCIKLNGQEGAL